MHEAASTSSNEAAQELLRQGASPFVVNQHGETAYDMCMRRDNKHLLRLIERYARISAFMQVRMSATGMMAMLPSRGKFMEKWVVVVPRDPPPDARPSDRVIHSQLLVYNDHVSNQPVAKIWIDGATMIMDRDRYLLKLHHTHPRPPNVRVEVDDGGLLCVALRDSTRPDHHGQAMRLMQVVNDNARDAYALHSGPQSRPLPLQQQAGASMAARPSRSASTAHAAPPHAARTSAQQQRPSAHSADAARPSGASSGTALPSVSTARVPAAATSAAAAPAASSAQPSAAVPIATPSAPSQVGAGRSDAEVAADLQRREMAAARISHTELHTRMEAMRTASGSEIATPAPTGTPKPAISTPAGPAAAPPEDDMCCICMEEPKRTAFIHGDTSHLCACKSCATAWFHQHRKCPVCGQACAMTVDVYS